MRFYPPYLILVLLLAVGAFAVPSLEAKPLYSYTDERGTRIITDNYENIPASYKAKVTAVEQEGDGSVGELARVGKFVGSAKGFVVHVPGMSFEQSKIITYAGMIGLLCLLAMNLSRSEPIRLLALWCLVLTGIGAPVLVYTAADDGAATVMKNKAAEIQQKQQDRLSHAQ